MRSINVYIYAAGEKQTVISCYKYIIFGCRISFAFLTFLQIKTCVKHSVEANALNPSEKLPLFFVAYNLKISLQFHCSSIGRFPWGCREFFCFLHLILLFWNQTFTWISLSPSSTARYFRSCPTTYCCCWNSSSKRSSCSAVKIVLFRLLLRMSWARSNAFSSCEVRSSSLHSGWNCSTMKKMKILKNDTHCKFFYWNTE